MTGKNFQTTCAMNVYRAAWSNDMELTLEQIDMIAKAQHITDTFPIILYQAGGSTRIKVKWKNSLHEDLGTGFALEDKTLALTMCPCCHRENYALNVLSGRCTWCPFDANKLPGDRYE